MHNLWKRCGLIVEYVWKIVIFLHSHLCVLFTTWKNTVFYHRFSARFTSTNAQKKQPVTRIVFGFSTNSTALITKTTNLNKIEGLI